MNKVRIVAAIAGPNSTTLYKEDGSTVVVKNDSFRTAAIMDEILPKISLHKVAEIDLDSYSIHTEIEKKTGGLLRFVKITGDAVKSLFKKQKINKGENSDDQYKVEVPTETTVAIVDGKKIPGAEKLEKHMENALATNNTVGLQRFMERIATVVNKRGHSVQELLRFMEKADLPIADDGSIIAYKVLRRDEDGRFLDCHSMSVSQAVGSRVSMNEKLVNSNRRVECATGLHIARRGYIKGFAGDLVVAVKVAPEDVIAVPLNEPNKMRAAAYHIVWELNEKAYTLLRNNQPMTSDPESAKVLANIIAGNHIGVTEHVIIGGPKGTDLTIKRVGEESEQVEQQVALIENIKAKAIDDQDSANVITPRMMHDKREAILANAAISGDMSAAISAPALSKSKKIAQQPAVDPKPAEAIVKMDATDTEKRDAQVMALIKEGKTQQQVADITGVNYRTVRRIVARNK